MYFERFQAPPLSDVVGRGDVPGAGQEQGDGQLGGRADVGGGGVDDHDAGLRGRGDVDVVQPDAGTGDDLEAPCSGDRLGVDLRGRADQDRVDVRDGREQLRAIGTVAVADLEVGTEGLHGGGAEFLGDQDDGLAHGWHPLDGPAGSIPTAGPILTTARRSGTPKVPTHPRTARTARRTVRPRAGHADATGAGPSCRHGRHRHDRAERLGQRGLCSLPLLRPSARSTRRSTTPGAAVGMPHVPDPARRLADGTADP